MRDDAPCLFPDTPLNISKREQRTLHALAQGGRIVIEKDVKGHIVTAECLTREGWALSDCDLPLFKTLKRRGFVASKNGAPYRITREGLVAMRPQGDNRTDPRRW